MAAVRIRGGYRQPDDDNEKPMTEEEERQAEEAVKDMRSPGRTQGEGEDK